MNGSGSRLRATTTATRLTLLLLAALLAGCGGRSSPALALVDADVGADATFSGNAVRLPGGASLVTYGDALDGQPAIRDAKGTLRALRDYIGWSWAAAMVDGSRVTAVLSCHTDADPHQVRLVGSSDGGVSWENRTVEAPSHPRAAEPTASGHSAPANHKELRLEITDHDAGGTLQRRTVLFMSEDGGATWYLAPQPDGLPNGR